VGADEPYTSDGSRRAWKILSVAGEHLVPGRLGDGAECRFARRSVGYIVSRSSAALVFFARGDKFSSLGGVILLVALMVFIASHAFHIE